MKTLRTWLWRAAVIALSGTLFQAGCLRAVQQNLELLWAPEANLNFVWNSALVDWFGPGVLKFW